MEIDALDFEFVDKAIAGTVVCVQEFQCAPMARLSLNASIFKDAVEIDEVRVNMRTVRCDGTVAGDTENRELVVSKSAARLQDSPLAQIPGKILNDNITLRDGFFEPLDA